MEHARAHAHPHLQPDTCAARHVRSHTARRVAGAAAARRDSDGQLAVQQRAAREQAVTSLIWRISPLAFLTRLSIDM
jgi:hypothetical protein